jgi:hypothetical protein
MLGCCHPRFGLPLSNETSPFTIHIFDMNGRCTREVNGGFITGRGFDIVDDPKRSSDAVRSYVLFDECYEPPSISVIAEAEVEGPTHQKT